MGDSFHSETVGGVWWSSSKALNSRFHKQKFPGYRNQEYFTWAGYNPVRFPFYVFDYCYFCRDTQRDPLRRKEDGNEAGIDLVLIQ